MAPAKEAGVLVCRCALAGPFADLAANCIPPHDLPLSHSLIEWVVFGYLKRSHDGILQMVGCHVVTPSALSAALLFQDVAAFRGCRPHRIPPPACLTAKAMAYRTIDLELNAVPISDTPG